VSLDERLAFERLLADLSAKFANVPGECLEDEIERALHRLLVFLGFDRCSYGELRPDGTGQILCAAALEGIEPLSRGPLPPNFDWLLNQVRSGKMIVYRSPDELPPEAVGEIEYVRRVGIRSNVVIPLSVGGRIVGGIAFAAFRSTRDWPEDLIARIKLIGEVFAQAVARKRADETLAGALREVQLLKERLEQDNEYLIEAVQARLPLGLTTRSPRFKLVLEEIAQVAPTGAPVLLMGETGTGKEVLAQAIHDMSARRQRPMIKINCAALPPTLIESELFGREKGAYTGALARQKGRFEIADGSTLLLDEIGDLPLELQPKLLRVLQDGQFERVGGTQTITVDVRVIAATNRDLARALAEGEFRDDLYYRLNVFPVVVPPLRERAEDIPLLAWTFVKEFAVAMGKPIERIADESMAALEAYPWPGNVRELRNVIERAMILGHGPTLHISLGRTPMAPAPVNVPLTLEEAERSHILKCLEKANWRIRGAEGAAVLLAVNPTTLESRMKKLGIVRPR
jgi:transcriptional regulator with GAF, ATPase, and Fis domain